VTPRFLSVLRNAALVELTCEVLELSSKGQSRLENLPDEERNLLENLLEKRFGEKIRLKVLAEKSSDTLTLKEKEDLQNQKEIEAKKKEAENDPLVQNFMKEFAGSKIIRITVNE
jgi:hypothetical protein